MQCCGYGCVRFWASRIRIRWSEVWIRIRIRILLSSSKNSKKKPWFLLFCDFFMTFSSGPSKSTYGHGNKQKHIRKNNHFLVSWKALTKIAESGSGPGSISQRYRSADPDPYQNVPDLQRCWYEIIYFSLNAQLRSKI